MRWLKSLVRRAAKFAGVPLRDPALVAMLGHQPSAAGVDVDEVTAMNLSAVWQAVNIISSNVAAMPPVPYRLTQAGRIEATDHWSHGLLLAEPNDEMTPYTLVETIQSHALVWGNGYAHLERANPTAPVTAIRPILPNQVTPQRNAETGAVEYRFQASNAHEESCVYEPWEVLHIAGVGYDGVKGYPVIQQARESVGLALAVEKYGAAFFGRGSTPGGILQLPEDAELSEKAKANLRESFELIHRGPDNAHRIAVLEDGIEYKTIGMPLETAQFLQTRQFQIVEIARWFNIPPHLLRDLSNATYSNIEHQGIDFLVYTLRPWLIRWQQELRRKLFGTEKGRFCVDHDTHTLLLTDVKARYEAYAVGRNNGWLTLNDIARRERTAPLPPALGESRLIPQNMAVLSADGTDALAKVETPGEVEASAMNGIQVSAMLTVVQACAAGSITPDTAEAMLGIAFPAVEASAIQAMIDPIREGAVTHDTVDGGAADGGGAGV